MINKKNNQKHVVHGHWPTGWSKHVVHGHWSRGWSLCFVCVLFDFSKLL